MIVLDSQVVPVLWAVPGIMPEKKKKGRSIDQVFKAVCVVLKPTRRTLHMLLTMPSVLKTATILDVMDAAVVTEEVEVEVVLPDVAAVEFEFESPPKT
jgi:hypothetical protein